MSILDKILGYKREEVAAAKTKEAYGLVLSSYKI